MILTSAIMPTIARLATGGRTRRDRSRFPRPRFQYTLELAPNRPLLPAAERPDERHHQMSTPRGRTSHDHRIRVPAVTASNVNDPSVSIIDEVVLDASSRGRSKRVNSTVIDIVRPIVFSSVWNWVAAPIGPLETCSARTMR
jgi:hypothetical protein